MSQPDHRVLSVTVAGLSALLLVAGGIDPLSTMGATPPAPGAATPPAGDAAAPSASAPAPAPPAASATVTAVDKPADKKAGKEAPAKTEVLPWANAPKTTPVKDATAEAADAACASLIEAACRESRTCAWIAAVRLEDGSGIPSRCVARAAPLKKKKVQAAKAPAPAKVKAKEPAPPPPEAAASGASDGTPAAAGASSGSVVTVSPPGLPPETSGTPAPVEPPVPQDPSMQ